ncbi:hypothetical protein HG263_03645 [Pseudoalteromonas sp. JBTF-M23]|uniref:Uncharacterized protein n=1 Tax=Pseudoalteromonas caenipelagi TaxID=2726988 RepID=A0A849V8U1_9GAMM|nr:hypothetical protein [Pseudoalteromonas caenipelagi]NOU49636.1 hypothetical protein [Pseudoalteromonas caenipelagi]
MKLVKKELKKLTIDKQAIDALTKQIAGGQLPILPSTTYKTITDNCLTQNGC